MCNCVFSCLKNNNCSRFLNLNKSIVGQLLGQSRHFSQIWGCPLNRGSTVSDVSISTNNQQMHFSALKFQDFLGKLAPRRRPPRKRGTYGPLVDTVLYSLYFNQLATWGPWLYIVLSCCLCTFVIFFFQVRCTCHKQTGSSLWCLG